MKLRLFVVLLACPPPARAELFDIAPVARRCSVSDTHMLQTTFDYAYTRRAGPSLDAGRPTS